jgi:peptidyl-prolyl cis-trans isomerase C
MGLILMLLALLPQDYMNLVVEGNYESAVNFCEKMIRKTNSIEWQIALGDLYLYQIDDPGRAEMIYRDVLNAARQTDGSVHYRLAQALELKEDYLGAAREYEIVATRFRKFPLDSFALSGVERCFKKNYQDYVAIVDGYNITRLELDERMASASPFAKKDEKTVLDQMVLERLLYVSALKNNIKDMDMYKSTIAASKKQALLDEITSVDIVAKAVPPEKEIKANYKKNKPTYRLNEEVRGKEIVVETESLAVFIRDTLLKDLASFDSLAKLYSVQPNKTSGGNFGSISKGTRPKEAERALFSIKPNTISAVVPVEGKFAIYLVTDHKPERYRSFDEMKPQIEATLRAERTKDIELRFMKKLKDKAVIAIFKDSLLKTEPNTVLALINDRKVTRQTLEDKNATQPQFGQVDLSKPEECEKLLGILTDDNLKLEYALRKKYYANEGYFTKILDAVKKALDQGLYTKIVIEAVTVDSNDIIAMFKERHEDMKIPESVNCREIVTYSRTRTEQIRKELISMYGGKSCLVPFFSKGAKVMDIAKFDSMAKAYSVSPSKERGGDVGTLRVGMRQKEYDDVAFKLKPGAISKVFVTNDSNYTVITVSEHTPVSYRTIEEVWPSLEMAVKREKQKKIVDEFLTKIKQEAQIQILLTEPEKEEAPEEKTNESKPPDVPGTEKKD